jgi:hypothetical protein
MTERVATPPPDEQQPRLSDQLDAFLSVSPRTLGDLVDSFGPGSFAILFVVLMAVPALPLPTGGVTHVFEVVAMLLALELVAGRREVWVPARLRRRQLTGVTNDRFRSALLRRIRWVERYSRPRLARLIELRVVRMAFGATVFGLSLTAFLAPPFSGLDTVPSLGVVVLSLGVLLRDFVVATVGALVGVAGVLLVIGLGRLILELF